MIGSSFPDGNEPADPLLREALIRLVDFAQQSQARFVNLAGLWMSRFQVDTIELSSEGAVNNAWSVLLERLRGGGLQPIHTLAEFVKVFTLLLRHVIVDERRRQNALKRARGRCILDSGLDGVASHDIRPDEYVIGDQQAEWLLAILERQDASLREIAILKVQGCSNAEIASQRGVSISTIERMLRESRSILGPYAYDRNRF
jgi:ECF sigma factor